MHDQINGQRASFTRRDGRPLCEIVHAADVVQTVIVDPSLEAFLEDDTARGDAS